MRMADMNDYIFPSSYKNHDQLVRSALQRVNDNEVKSHFEVKVTLDYKNPPFSLMIKIPHLT